MMLFVLRGLRENKRAPEGKQRGAPLFSLYFPFYFHSAHTRTRVCGLSAHTHARAHTHTQRTGALNTFVVFFIHVLHL